MMNRNTCLAAWIAIVIPLALVTSCKSGSRGTPTLIDDVESHGSAGIESFEQIYHLYPSPAEMLGVIDMTDISFDAGLLAPAGSGDRYIDTRSKSHMLGVYMTDLAYAALFGRHEATLDYLELVRTMAAEIRIDRAVDDDMIEDARENVEYLDSLYRISNEAFMNVLAFCELNDRSNTVVMMSAGAFVESLYLAVNLIDDYEKASQLLRHLADQKYTFDNFMTFAESVRGDDDHVASTIDDLQEIREIYKGIRPVTGHLTVTAEPEGGEGVPKKLVIGGGQSSSGNALTREEFESLKSAVITLRSKIVEGS